MLHIQESRMMSGVETYCSINVVSWITMIFLGLMGAAWYGSAPYFLYIRLSSMFKGYDPLQFAVSVLRMSWGEATPRQ